MASQIGREGARRRAVTISCHCMPLAASVSAVLLALQALGDGRRVGGRAAIQAAIRAAEGVIFAIQRCLLGAAAAAL